MSLRGFVGLGLAAVLIAVPAAATRAKTPEAPTLTAASASAAADKTPGDTGFVIVGSRNAAGFGLVRIFADNDFNGTYETLVDEFVPYSTTLGDGVRVAAGDFDGDGNDELVTASSENAPVKIYDLSGGGAPGALRDSVPGFNQGSYVAAGDLNRDGRDELIVGSDPGGEPKVKIFADRDPNGELEQTPVSTFNAYPASFTGGVRVATGNTDNQLDDELITGPGPNGPGLAVKIWDDTDHDRAVSDNPLDDSFVPYDPGFAGGTYVAAGPIDGAGPTSEAAEVIVAPGGGQNRSVLIRFDADNDGKVSDDPLFDQLSPPYGANFSSGVRVATGNADHNGFVSDELITAPGANAGGKPVRIYADDADSGVLLSDNPPEDEFSGFSGTFGEFVAFGTAFLSVYTNNDAQLAIPDEGQFGDPLQRLLVLPRSAGIVRDLNVSVNIGHTLDSDLTVSLSHTSGTRVVAILLFGHVGHDDDGFLVWLDDEAAADIATVPDNPNDFPIAGVFRPMAVLSAFDGMDASGPWLLGVNDTASGDVGVLNQWSLMISY